MLKKMLCMLTIIVLVCPAVCMADTQKIRGYDKAQGGYCYVTYGNYPYEEDGSEQAVLWRVLDVRDNDAFLLTEYIVDLYYTHWDSEAYYKFKSWQDSDLYVYLNGAFAERMFSDSERAALVADSLDQSLVAVMHVDDVRNTAYGFADNNSRLCKGTPYARTHVLEVNTGTKVKKYNLYTYKDKNSPWFLREKSTEAKMQQREVLNEGKLGRVGCTNADVGVRPCVHLDLSLTGITGGSGTKDDPYRLCSAVTAGENDIAATEKPAVESIPSEEQDNTVNADTIIDSESIPENENSPIIETTEIADAQQVFTAAAEPDGINEHFPTLTTEGFLPEGEGEFVFEDEENGLWLYCSQTLRIEITRHTGSVYHEKKDKVIRWYEAQIYTRDASEVFDIYPYDESRYKNIYAVDYVENIAKQHNLVFGVNGDYFLYRVERAKEEKGYNYPIGPVIRNSEIMYFQNRNTKSYTYPPLDVLALYPDGNMKIIPNTTTYANDGKTGQYTYEGEKYEFKSAKGISLNGRQQAEQAFAEQILASGATDTLVFGPWLVKDGQKADTSEWGTTLNPRTALGMVEKGHYIALVVEGRLGTKKISYGVDCIWMAEKMDELGCTQAINLDGGATTVMMFMGKQISVSGDYSGGLSKRKQNELVGIGTSLLVGN